MSERVTVGLCRDCRWWGPDGGIADASRFNQGGKIVIYNECHMARTKDGSSVASKPTLAVADDLESCRADLSTMATFGCVQFEDKAEEA